MFLLTIVLPNADSDLFSNLDRILAPYTFESKNQFLSESKAKDYYVKPDFAGINDIKDYANQYHFDFSLQNVSERHKSLFIFDMDSTIIQEETLDVLAETLGIGDKISDITEQAMQGEISFSDSLTRRLALLSGTPISKLRSIADILTLSPKVPLVIKTLQEHKKVTALLSSGLFYFVEVMAKKLGFNYYYGNHVRFNNNLLTTDIKFPILDASVKKQIMSDLSQQLNITLDQVMAIGDGANDIEMLSSSGLGVAFYAKPLVKKKVITQINYTDMTSILYFAGISEKKWIRN